MAQFLLNNWQLLLAGAGILLLVVPRLKLGSATQWAVGLFGRGKPTQHQLVDAYRLLIDNLKADDAKKALVEKVWPAIGGYRNESN